MSHKLPEVKPIIAIKDKNNPNSAINIAPQSVSRAIGMIPDEFFELTPHELQEKFRKERQGRYTKDTEIEEKLRIAFWREYDRASDYGSMMQIERICSGICHISVFNKAMTNSYRAAYICSPPEDYITTVQELLKIGLDQIRDILLQPHVDEQGRPQPRMADVKMKIVESLTNRVKGMVAHRVETKNLNVNMDADNARPKTEVSHLTDPDEIDRRLQELLEKPSSKPETIDVTPKS
jgi:hypothetical protein